VHLLRSLWAAVQWVYSLLDIVASVVGGWPVLMGGVFAAVTAVLGFIYEYGPLIPILCLYAAALAMVVFDYGGGLVARFQRASAAAVDLAIELWMLSDEYQVIFREGGAPVGVIEAWESRALDAVRRAAPREYFMYSSIPAGHRFEKFRRVTSRFLEKNHINPEVVAARVAERRAAIAAPA
jgi:hypothetical protein